MKMEKRKQLYEGKAKKVFATDDEIPRAHLSVENVADGYAECDVRLTAGHKK